MFVKYTITNVYGENPIGDYCARIQGVYNQGDIDGLRFYATTGTPSGSTPDGLQIAGSVSSLWFRRTQLDKGRINLTIGDDVDTDGCNYLRFDGLALESAALENLRLNGAIGCSFDNIYANLSDGYGLHSMPQMETLGGPCWFNGGQIAINTFENILIEGDPGIYFGAGFESGGNVSGSTYPQMRVAAQTSRFKVKDSRIGGNSSLRVDTSSMAPAAIQVDNLATIKISADVTATIGGSATAGDILTLTFNPAVGSTVSVHYTVVSGNTRGQMALGLVQACNAASASLPFFAFSNTGAVITINMPLNTRWAVTASVSGSMTETITLAGGLTNSDVIQLSFTSPGGSTYSGSYTVHTGDSLAFVTASVCAACLANPNLTSAPWTSIPFVVWSTNLSTGPGIIAVTMPPASAPWTFSSSVSGPGSSETVAFNANNPYFVIENSDLRGNAAGIIDNSPASAGKMYRDNMGAADALAYNINPTTGGTVTLTAGIDAVVQNSTGSLSSNLTVTLNSPGAILGNKFKWINNSTMNSHTVTVGGRALTSRQFIEFEFNGAAWQQISAGTLF